MDTTNPTIDRLEDQIAWYNKKSITSQRMYKWMKVATIVAAALVPLSASFSSSSPAAWFWPCVTGSLGVLIVILEGLQHLNQYQHIWTSYRSTCEALTHEKFLWLAKAGPYDDNPKAGILLAERVESLISQEHAKWVSTREQATKKQQS